MRVVDEFEDGFGWQADEPEFSERTSHAVRSNGKVWLFDVMDADGLDERVRALGEPAGVVQLLDRHGRDCASVAERLGVPLHVTPRGTDVAVPTRKVVWFRGWHEVAAIIDDRTLVAGDALGTASYFRAPGEHLGVHPMLRLSPPRALRGLEPEHVLCGHGTGVHGPEAADALAEALRTARRRIPRWLPASIRAWRRR
jgi:hypothetical protein